ncbi:MAG: hypothetical protein ACLFWB_12995 [Armatimonadota bacterium]
MNVAAEVCEIVCNPRKLGGNVIQRLIPRRLRIRDQKLQIFSDCVKTLVDGGDRLTVLFVVALCFVHAVSPVFQVWFLRDYQLAEFEEIRCN